MGEFLIIEDLIGRSQTIEAPRPLLRASSVAQAAALARETLTPGSYVIIDQNGVRHGYVQVEVRGAS